MRSPRRALFLCLILLATLLSFPLAIVPHVQAVDYFSNGFETFPTGWTKSTNGAGTITKSNTEFHSGSWSCRVYTPVAVDKAYAYRSITEATGDHHLQFWLFVPTGQEPVTVQVVGLFDIGVGYSIIAYLDYHDSAVYLFQPTGFLDIGIITINAWHKVDGFFNDTSNKVDWYIDNTFQIQLDAETGGVANPDRIYVGDTSQASQSANDVYYIDDILVDDVPGIAPDIPTELFGAGFNGSTPVIDLYWTHDMNFIDFFEVQNSTDKVSWDYLGQNTTAEYHDLQVVNGTERYYRVRACQYLDHVWVNGSFSDIDFETVYFLPTGPATETEVNVTGAWVDYNFTSIVTLIGNNTGGNYVNATYWKDGYFYNVTEPVGAPGYDIRFNVTGLPDNLICICLELFMYYDGSAGHTFQIEVWNFTDSNWDFVEDIPDICCQWFNNTLECVPDDYVQNGTLMGRLYHPSPGNVNHVWGIDYGKLRVYVPYEVECEEAPALVAMGKYYAMSIILLILGVLIGIGMRGRRR